MEYRKKIIWVCMIGVLFMTLSGCGKENQWVFSLHGEKLYEKEVRALGIIYANEYNIVHSEQLNEKYEGKMTYQEYYKEQFSESVVETVVLYAEAKKNGCKLKETEEQMVADKTEQLVNDYGEGFLETQNLTKDDIEKAYKKIELGDCYLRSQSDDGQSKEGEKDNTKLSEDGEAKRYIRVFQVTFPTVELDDEGMVISNQKGEVKSVSADDREKKHQEAESFAEAAKSGQDMKKLLKNYDNTVTGIERTLKYADLNSEYQKAVDGLKKNEVSDVINSDYGYYVIQMIDPNDEEYSGKIENYEAVQNESSEKNEIVKKLLDTYAKDPSEFRNDSVWDDISFASFVK